MKDKRTAELVISSRNREKIMIKFPKFGKQFSKDLQMIRSFDNRKFHNQNGEKFWIADISLRNLQLLKENDFEMDSYLQEKLKTYYIDWNKISDKDVGNSFLNQRLRSFQKLGVNMIRQIIGKGLIVLDMGLGKTILSLAFMRISPDFSPVLIVVPASIKLQWKKEAEKWLVNPNIEIISGTTPYKTTGEIVIVNYDILSERYKKNKKTKEMELVPGTGWVEELKKRNFQLIILDEATAIKKASSNRTSAVNRIGKDIPGKILLTGTPIENRPAEIFNAIRFIRKDLFPSKLNFDTMFCAGHHDGYGWNNKGYSNTKILHNTLSGTIMFRRKKEDVLPELPDKTTTFIPVEIDNRQEYKEAEENFIEYVRKTKGKYAAMRASNAEMIAQIEHLKQLAVKGKMQTIITWIKEMLEIENKLVVFVNHKFVSEHLLKVFKGKAVKIDGSVSTQIRKDGSNQRQDIVNRFENDSKIQLLIAQFQAGGVGLNLQFARNGAHLELAWNSSTHEQAIDRMHRMGQQFKVNEYFFVGIGTIEEDIAKMIDTKKKVSKQIVDGEVLEQESMLSKLIEKYKETEEVK